MRSEDLSRSDVPGQTEGEEIIINGGIFLWSL